MRASLERVEICAELLDYIVAIVAATRKDPQVQVGRRPRGGLALLQLARGQALLDQRDYVIPDDIKQVAVPALAHRVTLRPELWVRQVSADDVVGPAARRRPDPRTDPRADPAAPGGARVAAPAQSGLNDRGHAQRNRPPARFRPGFAVHPLPRREVRWRLSRHARRLLTLALAALLLAVLTRRPELAGLAAPAAAAARRGGAVARPVTAPACARRLTSDAACTRVS